MAKVRRGVVLGVVWFGVFVAVAAIVVSLRLGVSVGRSLFIGSTLLVVLAGFPFLNARLHAPKASDTPSPLTRGWADLEVATLVFGLLVTATIVVVGVVSKRYVLAAGCAVLTLLVLVVVPLWLFGKGWRQRAAERERGRLTFDSE